MKITIFILVFMALRAIKLMSDKNKMKSDGIQHRMKLKALEVKYEKAIGVIQTKEQFENFFKQFNLNALWKSFESKLKSEIRIETIPKNEIALGKSKFGGLPDLPKNIDWFKETSGKSLSFIAQLNLEEIQGFNNSESLPKKGMLYIFYSAAQEAWGYDYKDKDKFKVYCSLDTTNLEPKLVPSDLEDYDTYMSCELNFSQSYSLPEGKNDFVMKTLNTDEQEIYRLLKYPVTNHKIFGYANSIQGEMELECQLVTNGIYCGDPSGYQDPKRKELEKDAKDWLLLLQVDTDEKAHMMWGDCGRLYFWIKKTDLEKLNFEDTWVILQCY